MMYSICEVPSTCAGRLEKGLLCCLPRQSNSVRRAVISREGYGHAGCKCFRVLLTVSLLAESGKTVRISSPLTSTGLASIKMNAITAGTEPLLTHV